MRVSRSFFCSIAVSIALPGFGHSEPVGVTHTEFPEENAALVKATIAFFDRVEAFQPARKRLPIVGIPLTVTKSNATPEDGNALTTNGPVANLTGYQITWYPMERLFGTVDFMGTWNDNKNLVCGYLTWDMSEDAPVLANLAAHFVDISMLANEAEVVVHQSLLNANCAFGEIDANFVLFDPAG